MENYFFIRFSTLRIIYSITGTLHIVNKERGQYLTILLPQKNSLPGGFAVWLWFYWIDLTYKKKMPSTACRILLWFNFYYCLKKAKFVSRTKFTSLPNSFSRHFQLRTIYYRSIRPIWIKNVCAFHTPRNTVRYDLLPIYPSIWIKLGMCLSHPSHNGITSPSGIRNKKLFCLTKLE